MPKGEDSVAVDVRHCARGVDTHVAADQTHADHRAWLDTPAGIVRQTSASPLKGAQPKAFELAAKDLQGALREAAEGHGRRDGPEVAAKAPSRLGIGPGEPREQAPVVQGIDGDRGRSSSTFLQARDHLADGSDARQRCLGESVGKRYGAGQPALNVDRAAAHARQDTGFLERPADEAGEDDRGLGTGIVFQHAEDFDTELLDCCPGENGPARRAQTSPHVLEREEVLAAQRDDQ